MILSLNQSVKVEVDTKVDDFTAEGNKACPIG